MGRTYKRNDLYSTNRAKSLKEKRQQSRTKYKRENVNDSTGLVEKYKQPRTQFNTHTEDNWLDETNYNPLQSDWVDDMLFEDDYTTNDEQLPSKDQPNS